VLRDEGLDDFDDLLLLSSRQLGHGLKRAT